MIEVNDLHKSYGSTRAVDGISFTIDRGEVVGLLGPNGAGKSTAMRMLTCYIAPDAGDAMVGGYSILTQSLDVRRILGYLPESAPLYADMNVIDYLGFIADIHQLGDKKKSRLDEMVTTCGLDAVVYKDINELSKGYRQRVGLASAIIHDPDYLILDEPTTGLDPNQIVEIRNLIRRIGHEGEKCIVLSTHILPEVEATCDRAIIINNGKIVAEGTTDELTTFARGSDIYMIGLRGDKSAIENSLNTHESIASYRYMKSVDEEPYIYHITSSAAHDISEELFDMAVANGYKMTQLKREIARLEDIFRTITTREVE